MNPNTPTPSPSPATDPGWGLRTAAENLIKNAKRRSSIYSQFTVPEACIDQLRVELDKPAPPIHDRQVADAEITAALKSTFGDDVFDKMDAAIRERHAAMTNNTQPAAAMGDAWNPVSTLPNKDRGKVLVRQFDGSVELVHARTVTPLYHTHWAAVPVWASGLPAPPIQTAADGGLREALERLISDVRDIAGEGLLNWRLALAERCKDAEAAIAALKQAAPPDAPVPAIEVHDPDVRPWYHAFDIDCATDKQFWCPSNPATRAKLVGWMTEQLNLAYRKGRQHGLAKQIPLEWLGRLAIQSGLKCADEDDLHDAMMDGRVGMSVENWVCGLRAGRPEKPTPNAPVPVFDCRTAVVGSKWLTRKGEVSVFEGIDAAEMGKALESTWDYQDGCVPVYRWRDGRFRHDRRVCPHDIVAPYIESAAPAVGIPGEDPDEDPIIDVLMCELKRLVDKMSYGSGGDPTHTQIVIETVERRMKSESAVEPADDGIA